MHKYNFTLFFFSFLIKYLMFCLVSTRIGIVHILLFINEKDLWQTGSIVLLLLDYGNETVIIFSNKEINNK